MFLFAISAAACVRVCTRYLKVPLYTYFQSFKLYPVEQPRMSLKKKNSKDFLENS